MTFKKKALRKSDFKKLVIFSFLVFSLFSPHLNFMGTQIKTVYFFIVMPGVFGALIVLGDMKLLKAEFYFLLAMFLALIFLIAISFMAFAVDIGHIAAALRGILLFFSCYFFVHIYERIYKEHFLDTMLLHILYAVMINSILIVLLFLMPDFKSTWHSIFILSDTQFDQAMRDDAFVRLSGLVHSGFGSLSVLNAAGLVIALYLYMYSPYQILSLRKFTFCAAILFVSTVLVGRLGLVVMVMSIGLVFFAINSKQLLIKYLKMIGLLTLSLGLIGFMLYINFEERFIFGFITIFDFFLQGKLDTSTSLVLSEKLSPDLGFKDYLIGTGDYREETVQADSGYIRMIAGGGFLGLIVTYSFMLVPIIVVVKRGLPYRLLVLVVAFPLIILFINIKNVYYFAYNDIFQVYILIVLLTFKYDVVRSIPNTTINSNLKKMGS